MKPITKELLFELEKSHAKCNTKSVKWDSIFDTEEELLQALFHEKIHTPEDKLPMHKWCGGYEYIRGFRNYYQKHGTLTEKQMVQLKRLAAEIAYHIYCD